MILSCKLHKSINPWLLFGIGLVNLVPYVFVISLYARAVQVLVFYVLATGEKRIRLHYYVVLVLSVVLFYLFVPNGRVLFQIGSIPITELALQNGLYRGLSLCGYVFLSLWSISPFLRFPGSFGELLSTSLRMFTSMFDKIGGQLHRKRKSEQAREDEQGAEQAREDEQESRQAREPGKKQEEELRDSFAFVRQIDASIANQVKLYVEQETSRNRVREVSVPQRVRAFAALFVASSISWAVLFFV